MQVLDQAKTLSLSFFRFFINDIEQYLENSDVESLDMINEVSVDVLDMYFKIFLLLYADDTVLMLENVFSEYCKTQNIVKHRNYKLIQQKNKSGYIFKG